MPLESAGWNSTNLVGTQPLAVVNLAIIQPQTTMAAGVIANLSITSSHIVPALTVVSTAQAYIP